VRSGHGNWKTALVALALISAACSRHATRAALEIDPARLHAEVTPRSWTLLGPFPFSADDLRGPGRPYAGLNHDFLADLGKPEAGIRESDLATLPASRTSIHQDGAYVHLHKIFPETDYAVVYAATVLGSAAAGDIATIAGSDDGIKLWLNGVLLVDSGNTVERGNAKYQHIVRAHLNKGRNLLLAKVDQKVLDWSFSLRLAGLEEARRKAVEYHAANVLKVRILVSGEATGRR
jgi:hypothetical protein